MYKSLLLFFFAMPTAFLFAEETPPPIINSVTAMANTVEEYGKFEATIDLTAAFANPYNYDEISVSATFTSPGGAQKTINGFFMQDYQLNTTNGNLSAVGNGSFRIRFSPKEAGIWHYVVKVTDASGTAISGDQTFECIVGIVPNKGFVRTNQTNYLNFDDGSQYIPIGENIAWQNNNPYLNYKAWVGGMVDNGGNFLRLWHAHWGLGLEWQNGNNGFQGLRKYKQNNCFYQDWLFDYCAANGVYVMLALQHHGPVSTQVNPNWNESPYNVANGGPCQNTWDFFTNEQAKADTKNRYRYIVARWGYASSILCWELFNEVIWTDDFQNKKGVVADWHIEMAGYLKSIDPNSHIVTTSYGDDFTDETVWAHPDIDLTQTHFYINTPHLERALANGSRNFLTEFQKPTLNGEFGLGGSVNLTNADPDGIHIHNALWGSLFSGAMGTAMTWWWDNYIHPKNLYYHFAGVAEVAAAVPFLDENLSPANAYVTGAPGDLVLTPTLGWSGIGDAEISIDANGAVTPMGAALSQFLYGSLWNTQFRSPPVFSVNYPAAGQFSVKTGAEIGTLPKIAIYLDSVLKLEQAATPNTLYNISVPAGMHTLKVDNTGTDWTQIASYTFDGLGSLVDAYVLVSEAKNTAAGWALNNAYNHENVATNGIPDPAPATQVVVEGFQNGTYSVHWFDPLTGIFYGGDVAVASGGTLSIPLNPFLWDVAFLVNGEPVAVKEESRNLKFELFPNPASAGAEVKLTLPEANDFVAEISLLDEAGRPVPHFEGQTERFQLPTDLAAGLYWVVVKNGGKIGAQAVVVTGL